MRFHVATWPMHSEEPGLGAGPVMPCRPQEGKEVVQGMCHGLPSFVYLHAIYLRMTFHQMLGLGFRGVAVGY